MPPKRLDMRQAMTLAIRRQRGTEFMPVPGDGVGCGAWAGILPKRRNVLANGFLRTVVKRNARQPKKASSAGERDYATVKRF